MLNIFEKLMWDAQIEKKMFCASWRAKTEYDTRVRSITKVAKQWGTSCKAELLMSVEICIRWNLDEKASYGQRGPTNFELLAFLQVCTVSDFLNIACPLSAIARQQNRQERMWHWVSITFHLTHATCRPLWCSHYCRCGLVDRAFPCHLDSWRCWWCFIILHLLMDFQCFWFVFHSSVINS